MKRCFRQTAERNAPNYRMKMRQTAERKPAKLPNENRPNYRIVENIGSTALIRDWAMM